MGSKHITFVLAVIPEGERLPWHVHEGAEEVICVLPGTGSAHWDTEMKAVHPGTVLCMEADSNHRIVNEGKGEAKLLCAGSPRVKIGPPK
jgi:quercetin dioxygenase-like cupin family protein